jgi:monoamine oxidase
LSDTTFDVVIVGAGFAGLVAARELNLRGCNTVILEARDRIGGRTWVDERLGRRLELGGAWVHWAQPHVWTEMMRYGIAIKPSMDPTRALWFAEGELKEGSPDELFTLLDRGNVMLLEETRRYFPYPYEPLSGDGLEAIDHVSVLDKIRELDLSQEERDLLETFWALNFSAPPESGAYTQALRWCAAASASWPLMFEACSAYLFKDGSDTLANAIAADGKLDVRFGVDVSRVQRDTAGVVVASTSGDSFSAKTCVVTAPLNALGRIEFDPPLSPGKASAAREGQASRGVKVWARVSGALEPFVAFGGREWPISLLGSEYFIDDDTLVVGFGPDAELLSPNDSAAVQEVIRRWLPDADVVDCTGHDWLSDPYAGETWPMQRPGQLTQTLRDLQTPEGAVFLAGSDYASGWAGFIDGAIESGLQASRMVGRYLRIAAE